MTYNSTNLIQKETYLNDAKLQHFGCHEFFQSIMDGFHEELQHLSATFFAHESIPRYVFALNEATWVGLLNNVIVRVFGDQVYSLQEMGIYQDGKYFGRADYLVHWKGAEGSDSIFFLFEAKQYEESSINKLRGDSTAYLNSIFEQGFGYYNANRENYGNSQVFIVSVAFGWMRDKKLIEEAKKYPGFHYKYDESVDFCSLYCTHEDGVWLYGKLYNAIQD